MAIDYVDIVVARGRERDMIERDMGLFNNWNNREHRGGTMAVISDWE